LEWWDYTTYDRKNFHRKFFCGTEAVPRQVFESRYPSPFSTKFALRASEIASL